MPDSSLAILDRFSFGNAKDIDLVLRPAYYELLEKLGNPHQHLPPVFHVAGTNGKGSTCAFLRAILEAAGYKVHVNTSPHLVNIHERIRLAGKLIEESELVAILNKAEQVFPARKVSTFEALTAAALTAFAQHPADYVILETGLGGRLDATNIVEKPLATLITRLSYDHRDFLGDSLEQIAREKAGIMRANVPCYTALQPDASASATLRTAAQALGAPLSAGGTDWRVEETANGFRYTDATRTFDLPLPALLGKHQLQNAGLAIAALASLPEPLTQDIIAEGLRTVEWPARLQRLTDPALTDLLPSGAELWLDGGHNDSAGEVLATQIENWHAQDGAQPRPLYVVLGMITTKRPAEFLSPFAEEVAQLRAVPIPDSAVSFDTDALAALARAVGIDDAEPCADVPTALADFARAQTLIPPRILICGSLYLAGHVLSLLQQKPLSR